MLSLGLDQVQATAIESDLHWHGKTEDFIKRQQTAIVYKTSIIAEMAPAGQTLNEPTHGSCKVGWWGDSIVHQYEI